MRHLLVFADLVLRYGDAPPFVRAMMICSAICAVVAMILFARVVLTESLGWFLVILCVPFGGIVYAILHFDRVKLPLTVLVLQYAFMALAFTFAPDTDTRPYGGPDEPQPVRLGAPSPGRPGRGH